jgi:hypothetical protein
MVFRINFQSQFVILLNRALPWLAGRDHDCLQ